MTLPSPYAPFLSLASKGPFAPNHAHLLESDFMNHLAR